MDSCRTRPAYLLWALPILLIATLATSASAQSLFEGVPSLSSFGVFRGAAACGERSCPSASTNFYVGWTGDSKGAKRDSSGAPVNHEIGDVSQQPITGVWLGLTQQIGLTERFGLIGSGWYLIPSNTQASGHSDRDVAPSPKERKWDATTNWWYVDGLVAVNVAGGCSFLAGLRYDNYTTHLQNPFDLVNGPLSSPTDTADGTSYAVIPMFGTQVAYECSWGRLSMVGLGAPVVWGSVKNARTNAGVERLEQSGTFDKGYLLEFFADYAKRFGPGQIGVFGRWNLTQAESTNVSVDYLPGLGSGTFDLTLNRTAWTLGGSFSLDFNLPI